MEIIDSTLSLLDDSPPQKKHIIEFLDLLNECGISSFLISKKIYEKIYDKIASKKYLNYIFYMEIDKLDDINKFIGIKYFIQKKQINNNVISLVQINDTREILQLKKYNDAMAVALIGMDDFMCYDFQTIIKDIFSKIEKKKIYFIPENSNECATAQAVMFVKYGGTKVVAAFAGLGNRAATEQVILALRLNLNYKVNQDLSKLPLVSKVYENLAGETIPRKMPVIGSEIFVVESGIHVDGILKKSINYEGYPPELVGQKRKIVIGKNSGISGIKEKTKELGYSNLEDEVYLDIVKTVKLKCNILSRNLTQEELKSIVEGCL